MHEYLEIFNTPIYFSDFAKSLEDNGLAYIAEVDLSDVFQSELGVAEFDEFINENFENRTEKEQMLDFFANKMFRRSMITHKEQIGENFNVDIGTNELYKLHLSAEFNQEDEVYTNLNHVEMKSNYNWLYQVFSDVYPASINFFDVAAPLKSDENAVTSAFYGFMEILAANCAKLTTYERPKIAYEAGKTRLKQNLRGYFEYFSAETKPVIKMADTLNMAVDLTPFDAFIALKFDGKNSLEDITKQATKFAKEKNLAIFSNGKTAKLNGKNDSKKSVQSYINDLEIKLCDGEFFEQI